MSHLKEARRVGLLNWEADVEMGSTVFTFRGWTKAGATRQAASWLTHLTKEQEHTNG